MYLFEVAGSVLNQLKIRLARSISLPWSTAGLVARRYVTQLATFGHFGAWGESAVWRAILRPVLQVRDSPSPRQTGNNSAPSLGTSPGTATRTSKMAGIGDWAEIEHLLCRETRLEYSTRSARPDNSVDSSSRQDPRQALPGTRLKLFETLTSREFVTVLRRVSPSEDRKINPEPALDHNVSALRFRPGNRRVRGDQRLTDFDYLPAHEKSVAVRTGHRSHLREAETARHICQVSRAKS